MRCLECKCPASKVVEQFKELLPKAGCHSSMRPAAWVLLLPEATNVRVRRTGARAPRFATVRCARSRKAWAERNLG